MHLNNASSGSMRSAARHPKSRWQVYRLSQALIRAVASGEVDRAKKLISCGANVNFQNREGESPLTFAAAWGQFGALKLLLARGADPNSADRTGGTPLMLAAQHGSPGMVQALLQKGANPQLEDNWRHTALMHADWRKSPDEEAQEIRDMIESAIGRSRTLVAN